MRGTSIDPIIFLRKHLSIGNSRITREFLAEFFGTFIMIIFGNGSVAQNVLTGGTKNDFFSVVWAWAIGIAFGILIAGGVSGGHVNPAVTFSLASWGRFPWFKVPIYMAAQYLGSFCASACIYGVYIDAFNAYEGKNRTINTAKIFATYPGVMVAFSGKTVTHLTAGSGFGDQVFGTMLFLICIMAINDRKNMGVPRFMNPLLIGFAVLNIGLTYGFNSGFALNPARDLGPRIFTLIAGWGTGPFTITTADNYVWWWIPVIGPHIGALLGVAVYSIFIEIHHPYTKKAEDNTGVSTTSKQQNRTNKMGATLATGAFKKKKKMGV